MVIKDNKAIFSDGVTLEIHGTPIDEGEYSLTRDEEEPIFWALVELGRAWLDLELAQEAVKAFVREIDLLRKEEGELRQRKAELQKRLMGALNSLVAVL